MIAASNSIYDLKKMNVVVNVLYIHPNWCEQNYRQISYHMRLPQKLITLSSEHRNFLCRYFAIQKIRRISKTTICKLSPSAHSHRLSFLLLLLKVAETPSNLPSSDASCYSIIYTPGWHNVLYTYLRRFHLFMFQERCELLSYRSWREIHNSLATVWS